MPAIPCTEKFIAELAENENFPSNFYNLIVKNVPTCPLLRLSFV